MRGKRTDLRKGKMGKRRSRSETPGGVIDLFCGAGGLSHGFYLEGFDVLAGVDTDEGCRFAFEHNNRAPFIRRDIAETKPKEIDALFSPGKHRILIGCAPCQPFSTYNQKNSDPKWQLLTRFGGLIDELRPDVLSMENVPRLLNFRRGTIFNEFVETLSCAARRPDQASAQVS
jgi:DNA (cytosine-5)-methyltransferase 1